MEQIGLDTEIMQITSAKDARLDSLRKAKSAARTAGAQSAEINKAAEEFEAQFIAEMLQTMFSTVEKNEVFGGGNAEETYQQFLVDEYGKILARAGGIGVADHVKRELLRFQETSVSVEQARAGAKESMALDRADVSAARPSAARATIAANNDNHPSPATATGAQ